MTTPDKKGFYEFLTNKSEIKIVYLLVGSQFIEKQVMLNENNEVNIDFKTKTEVLSEVVIKGQKIREFQLKRLKRC